MSLAESITIGIYVKEHYQCNHCFRRGAENKELDNWLDNSVIEFVHRWSYFEESKGKQPGLNMLEHYSVGANIRYLQTIFFDIL